MFPCLTELLLLLGAIDFFLSGYFPPNRGVVIKKYAVLDWQLNADV